jgi:hypothetical protein
LRPLHCCCEQRFLNRVLGRGEVSVAADERAEDLRRELAQQSLDAGVRTLRGQMSSAGALITSRTSIGMFNGAPPRPGAVDAFAAIAIARSRLSQSTIQ